MAGGDYTKEEAWQLQPASRSVLSILTNEDFATVRAILPGGVREPDLTITEDSGEPYLHRWYVVPRGTDANVYMHLQVQSDPERPLHDHPWDNQSVILAGGYNEMIQEHPPEGGTRTRVMRKGQTCWRRAEAAHRLILPKDIPYTLTLFSTGPTVRPWGFWMPKTGGFKWVAASDCLIERDGVSRFRDLNHLKEPQYV